MYLRRAEDRKDGEECGRTYAHVLGCFQVDQVLEVYNAHSSLNVIRLRDSWSADERRTAGTDALVPKNDSESGRDTDADDTCDVRPSTVAQAKCRAPTHLIELQCLNTADQSCRTAGR
jgi:hypothetical protein